MPLPKHPRLAISNFDLWFLFAGTVCLVHAYVLSGFAQLAPIAYTLSSTVAVRAFFVISGFLIFMSYEQSSSNQSYFRKRVRRIYPAYVVVVLGCALLLVLVSTKPAAEYFGAQWLKYIAANLLFLNFLQPTLPGVFESNALNAVNGALWTLKIEVMFYVAVPVLVFLFRRFSRPVLLAVMYVLSVAYAEICTRLAGGSESGMYVSPWLLLAASVGATLLSAILMWHLVEKRFLRHNRHRTPAAGAREAVGLQGADG